MKEFLIVACVLSVAVLSCRWAMSIPPGSPEDPATMPAKKDDERDEAAEVVAAFYRALLQEDPPTLEQENSIFDKMSGLRTYLVKVKGKQPDDPVLLQYFRDNKEWFLPKGMRSLTEIQISSLARFVRDVERVKEPRPEGWGFVTVIFVRDREIRPHRLHTIIFNINGGKIAADAIWLDGFGGASTLDVVLP